MTSHPSTYLWESEIRTLIVDDIQDYQEQSLQPMWAWVSRVAMPVITTQTELSPKGYDPCGYKPQSERSMPVTPESSYHETSLEYPFCHQEDLIDLQRIGTPMSDQEPAVNVDTTGTGANKRIRRREQNRASYVILDVCRLILPTDVTSRQRAYRDRQRGKIAELQSKVVALKSQNEKLLARNNMLEAAFQRDRPQISSAQKMQRSPTSHSSNCRP